MATALLPAAAPLGSRAAVDAIDAIDAVAPRACRFRLEFSRDARTRELRWVLFCAARRGAAGKLVFTLERGGEAAHIKALAVGREWRGLGLARVLFLACRATLMELGVQRVELEAEEDARRHGKLVALYEDWGFQVTPGAKVLFLYNDAECFRKVPMALTLRPERPPAIKPTAEAPSTANWFCMLTLRAADGSCLAATEDGEIEARPDGDRDALWQTLLGAESGEVFLRSVHGKFLCVEESGHVLADRPLNSTWETFQVVALHDQSGVALRNFHGGYLCIDSDHHTVVSSREPVPWDGGSDLMSLVCNKHDARPLYARIMRKHQTKTFVKREINKFGGFQRAAWSVRDACYRVMDLVGDAAISESWILRYMLASAQAVRNDGHPDWLQLATFLRALGLLFLQWTDDENAVLRSISAHEWLASNSTWLLDTRIPDTIDFPELNELNADHKSAGSPALASVDAMDDSLLMPWTPDEYLYRALVHNKSSLPAEALAVIRLWSLKPWYIHGSYSKEFSSATDADTKEWLSSLIQLTRVSDAAIKEVDPEMLLPYYLSLADKYLPTVLEW